jgi:hypothetical protein
MIGGRNMKLPILNLTNEDRLSQMGKVKDEINEWQKAEPLSDNDIEESLDVIQALIGYLLKIVPDVDELDRYAKIHYQKLISRGWDTDGHIELKFHYK